MAINLDEATQKLRELILGGAFEADEKLREVSLSKELAVSRTLVRLALSEVEKEGLVNREPNRGFRVMSFTLDQVTDAISVRGELEGMAARLCAEHGVSSAHANGMQQTLSQMDDLLEDGLISIEFRVQWIELNATFHQQLLRASGNAVIEHAVDHLSRMPLVSARALVFDQSDADQSLARLKGAHQDHKDVLDAILHRQGDRAHHIMREHARKSAANKAASFKAMQLMTLAPSLPGLALVRA